MDIKESFKQINLVNLAMIVMQFALLMVSVFLVEIKGVLSESQELNEVFFYFIPIFSLICIVISKQVYKIFIKQNKKEDISLDQRLSKYKTAVIVRLALLEAPTITALVAYLLLGHYIYLGVAVLMLAFFTMSRVTRQGIINDCNLSFDEQNQLA